MAISYVGAGSVVTGTSVSPNFPSGVQEGDLCIIIMGQKVAVAPAITGWTTRFDGTDTVIYTRYYTNGLTAPSLTGQTSATKAVMVAYRGAGSYDVLGTEASGTGTTATSSTITTTYANDYVLTLYSASADPSGVTFTAPAGTTSRINSASTSAVFGLLLVDELKATAGVTTARAATLSISNAWTAVAIAFVPTRTLYWVGGAGTWNTTTTGDWANTSGGSPTGIRPPVQNENVIIDSSSGTGIITCTGGVCNDLTVTTTLGITLGASASTLSIFGSMTLPSGGSFVVRTTATVLSMTFAGNSAKTITTNGKTLGLVTFNGVGGTWTLQSALTAISSVTLTNGTLNLNNNTLTTSLAFLSSNSNTRAIQFGTGNITLSGSSATVLSMATATGFTYTGTPSVISSYTGATGTRTFSFGNTAGGTEANALNLAVSGGADTVVTTPISVFGTINFTGFVGTLSGANRIIYRNLTISTGMAISGSTNTTTFAATSGTQLITSNGKTINFPITKDGAGTLQLQDALTLGTTRTLTLTRGTLDLNNFSLTTGLFSSTDNQFRAIAFGSANITVTGTATVWATANSPTLTSTGTKVVNVTNSTATATNVDDQMLTEANSFNFNFTAGTYALTLGSAAYGSLNFTGFAGTLNNSNRTIYGDVTLSSGMTITAGTSTQTFAKSSGTQELTTNSNPFGCPVTKTGAGSLKLIGSFLSVTTFSLTEGTLDLNSRSLGCFTFNSSNTNVRAITNPPVGRGIQVASVWNVATATNFSPNGVNIGMDGFTSAAMTFNGGGATYGYLRMEGGGVYVLTVTGNNTFTKVYSIKTTAGTLRLTAGSTQTVTDWDLSGTVGNVITLDSTSAGTRATISQASGTVNVSYCNIKDSNATGGATFNALLTNNNVDSGNNLGWIFTAAPSNTFGMLMLF